MDKDLDLIKDQIKMLDEIIREEPDAKYINGIRLARNILEEYKNSISNNDYFAHIPKPGDY